MSLRPLFCLFLSGCFRPVLLYIYLFLIIEENKGITVFKIFICGGISSNNDNGWKFSFMVTVLHSLQINFQAVDVNKYRYIQTPIGLLIF